MNPHVVASIRSRLFPRSAPSENGKKALTEMIHHGQQSSFVQVMLPATNFDYKKEVGDGLGSSVLAAPLNWLMRTFPEAPPIVEELKNEEWQIVPGHGLIDLLRRPNPFYGGRTLWMATVLDLAFGEAFWLKIRNELGKVIQLWWVPRTTMEPKWPNDGKTFISHYEYRPQGMMSEKEELAVKDVIHFRFGIDSKTRRGVSELGALWREIATDDQAANFTAAILRNLGIIGIVIAPKEGGTVGSREAVEEVKKYIHEHFTGDKRGEPLALGAPTDVNVMQYNLQGFDVSPIRDVSEERVCACLGLPAAVVGFGTGLHQTKVGATMKELRRSAWTDCIIPRQSIIADQLDLSLLEEFPNPGSMVRFGFDYSRVPALWEDAKEKHERIRKDLLAGGITVKTFQQLLGYPVDEDRDVYLQPMNLLQLPDGSMGSGAPQGGTQNAED